MSLNFTTADVKNRKENAIKLLNAHADKYRKLYSDIADITTPTAEQMADIQTRRKWLDMESDSIHSQLNMLNELQFYAEQAEKE